MVLDRLTNAARYQKMHPLFEQAFRFLQEAEVHTLSLGHHEIVGKELFAIVSEGKGVAKHEAKLEVHRRYIDIQYIVSGTDHMGYLDLSQLTEPTDAYGAERDAAFYAIETVSWFDVPAGSFTIFYPNDAHAPLATEDIIRKVVLKIAVEK